MSDEIAARIAELKTYQAGWLWGEGEAFNPEFLDWVGDRVQELVDAGVETPAICGWPPADVVIEWHVPGCHPSLDIAAATRAGYWHVRLPATADGCDEKELDMTQPESWAWVVAQLLGIGEAKGE